MNEALLSEDAAILPIRRPDTSLKHVLAIDQGTTGTTALMMAADGRRSVCALAAVCSSRKAYHSRGEAGL